MLGYCFVGVLPMKKEPNSACEQISQMLFGDIAQIIEEEKDSWVKVKNLYDDYLGYVDKRNLIYLSEKEYYDALEKDKEIFKKNKEFFEKSKALLKKSKEFFCLDNLAYISIQKDNSVFYCPVPKCSHFLDIKYSIKEYTFEIQEMSYTFMLRHNKKNITDVLYSYMNCPYQWGGRSPFGLDCSGFTQNVFMLFGKKLSRDACDQEKQGKIVDDLKNSKYGDLAFFENKDKKVTHVGIILDNNKIIHCSSRVRIDDLDNKGIIDTDTKDYSHILHSIKRIF
jgi:hypothetical protein